MDKELKLEKSLREMAEKIEDPEIRQVLSWPTPYRPITITS